MGWRFAPLPGGHGFGAEAQEVVSPEQLSALDNAARDELAEALDEHALVVIRLSERAEPAQLAAFAKGMWGSCVDFSQTPADAASGTGRPCSAPGVPEVRVLGNTTDSGAPDSLLCRIGSVGLTLPDASPVRQPSLTQRLKLSRMPASRCALSLPAPF